MKILLTGGSGFVGRHLLETLGNRYAVTAPSHSQLDVTNPTAIERALRETQFDAVIHAAVQGGASVLDSTLRAFWNLHQNASHVGRIIYFGSGAEYGKHRDLVKIRERSIGEVMPRDPYGFAKMISTTLARQSSNIVNLRLFGIYGPYEGYLRKFISNSVAKVLLGEPITIRQDVIFDYLWIDDLVSIIPAFLEGPRSYADVNVTPTRSVSLAEIAAVVLREAGLPPEFSVELPGMNYQYTGSNERLLETQPAIRFTSIEEGVRRLMTYYRDRLGTLDRDAIVSDAYRREARTRQTAESGEGHK